MNTAVLYDTSRKELIKGRYCTNTVKSSAVYVYCMSTSHGGANSVVTKPEAQQSCKMTDEPSAIADDVRPRPSNC